MAERWRVRLVGVGYFQVVREGPEHAARLAFANPQSRAILDGLAVSPDAVVELQRREESGEWVTVEVDGEGRGRTEE